MPFFAGFARIAKRSDRSSTTRHAGSEPSSAPLRFAIRDGCCAGMPSRGDRATPELMELPARLGSMLPYRQAPKVMPDFLPTEPTETHATDNVPSGSASGSTTRSCRKLACEVANG